MFFHFGATWCPKAPQMSPRSPKMSPNAFPKASTMSPNVPQRVPQNVPHPGPEISPKCAGAFHVYMIAIRAVHSGGREDGLGVPSHRIPLCFTRIGKSIKIGCSILQPLFIDF